MEPYDCHVLARTKPFHNPRGFENFKAGSDRHIAYLSIQPFFDLLACELDEIVWLGTKE